MASFGLSARQALFVAGLALGKSQAESARLASVSERTGRRWWASPVVRDALRRAQAEMMGQAAHLAASEASETLRTLADIRDDAMVPASSRVMACRALLDNARGLHDDFALSERVAEIERMIKQNEQAT